MAHDSIPPIDLRYEPIDAEGNVLRETRQSGPQTSSRSFSYDSVSQLEAVTSTQAFGDALVDLSYSYDDAGRLLADGEFTFTYDLEGRLIAKAQDGSGVTDRYEYDAEGQLRRYKREVDIQGSPQDVLTVTYDYDPLGRRYQKSVNGVVTKYIYDGIDILHELDGHNRIVRTYTHGLSVDEPLAVRDMITEETHFFHSDRLGSVVAFSQADGSVAQEYFYDEYGNPLSNTGQTGSSFLSYTAREQELDSGLFYYRARYYDARIGRFLSEDPIGLRAGPNLYGYVGNNPINRVDPMGLAAQGTFGYFIQKWMQELAAKILDTATEMLKRARRKRKKR